MPIFYNTLGSQTITGSKQQDRFYAFTSDINLGNALADSSVAVFNWTTALRTSATGFFTITGNNIQLSSDFLAGGENTDYIFGSNANDAILFNNGVISGGIGSFSLIEQIDMGAGDDIVDLTAHGASGLDYTKNVVIRAGTGNDTIVGGAGMDTIYGDEGDDLLFGWRGADTLYGGAGNDIIYGDDFGFNGIAGDDFLYGQAGNDVLIGGARVDQLDGGDGNDTLYGGAGNDTLRGGADDDILYGDDAGISGNDKLFGDAGNDQLFGGEGSDEIWGGAGNDVIEGGDGNDFLFEESGYNTIKGGAGNDTINGGIELDTVVFSGNISDYSIIRNFDSSFTITDLRIGSPDGADTILGVEFFQFADGTVSGINSAPNITSDGGSVFAFTSLLENTTYVTTVIATDLETPQDVIYSIVGGLDASLFTIDPVTGVLAFISAPDFEYPIDSGGNNVYDLRVRATDKLGAFDEQIISVSVTDIPDGSPPRIISNFGGPTATVSPNENSPGVALVKAVDPDGTAPTYSIVGGADAALFSIDSQTGVLRFINAPDFERPLDVGMNNGYHVVVQASDGVYFDQQQFVVNVQNINDNAPTIASSGGGATASIEFIENRTGVAVVYASDADGDLLTYSIEGGADAALFTIDPVTGVLAFISAPDFEAPGDFDGNNVYDVIIRASDGTFVDDQAISVTVNNFPENPPIIMSNGGGATAAVSISENSAAVTTVTAIDADGTSPTFSIAGGADAALFFIDPQTGALAFINNPDFETPIDADANGTYEVIVRAFDGIFFDEQALSVTVTDVNDVGRTITGSSGNNIITPTATNIALQTTALNDTIYALAGNDVIDGGAGADRMEGGTGDDTYFVDRFSDDGVSLNDDQVIEAAGAGVDLVNSTVSYILTANVENLTLLGSAAIYGTGNDLANIITGNGANNILSGGLGNDILNGGDGNDTLLGGAGADRLDGGTGADMLEGGDGNDIYFVDQSLFMDQDFVIEFAGGGIDTIYATVDYGTPDEVENLVLVGPNAISGGGNSLANVLTGTDGLNYLYGLDGDDTLNGAGGTDFLFGGEGNDTINGGADRDELYGEGGADTLNGGDGNDLIIGGNGNDTLKGQAGDDALQGGKGRDSLSGGLGSDSFGFDYNDTSISSSSYDIITDFVTGVDKIDIMTLPGLSASAYVEGAITSNLYSDALASAQSLFIGGKSVAFVAGTTDGWLFWDHNRDGIIDQAVLLKGLGSLNALDFSDIM